MHKVIVTLSYKNDKAKRKIMAIQYECENSRTAEDFIRFLQGETRETGALRVMTEAYARGVAERQNAERRRERKCS
jgi:plasmid replication initiation protein